MAERPSIDVDNGGGSERPSRERWSGPHSESPLRVHLLLSTELTDPETHADF